jgi:glycosyltransferase involved in cell wall biosynthesis
VNDARTDHDEQLSPRGAALESTVASLAADVPRTEDVAERLAALEQAVADHGRQLQVRAVMDWIERATLRSAPLVSVVLPTRDRRDLLPRAIDSVQKQSYGNWELLIVDDGSVDRTAEFLAGLAGDRVRCFRHHGAGACAARNVALTQARGDLIAYLDDDNMMHPAWLKGVVWGFEQRPEASVLYGAYVVDDAGRIFRKTSGDLPRLFFLPYDYYEVARRSIADIGCIAHRAGLPEARFDESLREMGDWDLFLRLTRTAPPLALPAIACFYTTDAPNRLSHGPTFAADVAAVRAKNRR